MSQPPSKTEIDIVAAKRALEPNWPWNFTRSLAEVGWPRRDHPSTFNYRRPSTKGRREYERQQRIKYAGAE